MNEIKNEKNLTLQKNLKKNLTLQYVFYIN